MKSPAASPSAGTMSISRRRSPRAARSGTRQPPSSPELPVTTLRRPVTSGGSGRRVRGRRETRITLDVALDQRVEALLADDPEELVRRWCGSCAVHDVGAGQRMRVLEHQELEPGLGERLGRKGSRLEAGVLQEG